MKTEGQGLGERTSTILDEILAVKREEVSAMRPPRDIGSATPSARRRFRDALATHPRRPALIAEVKRRSPSAGWIRRDADAADVAAGYVRAGAAAVSVLTDSRFFGGSMEDLRAVRSAVDVPVLRKDFIIDPVQIDEASAAGADAVLLIVAALGDPLLGDLLRHARGLGLDALVEVHDGQELERALAAGADVIGVNARNLQTFEIRHHALSEISADLQPGPVLVAESGLRTPADVARLAANRRVDAMLIGGALMEAADPEAAAAELAGATTGRETG